MLKFQEQICNQLLSYSFENLPHTIMLIGEEGCGKHTLSQMIANNYNLQYLDITDKIDYNTLIEIEMCTVPTLYVISVDNITEVEQNKMLKFIEEPSDVTYIVITCADKSLVIDTIYNRCIKFEFERYDEEQLKEFLVDNINESVIKYCKTPGDVLKCQDNNVEEIYSWCKNIITKIHLSNMGNVLYALPKRLKWSEKDTGYDVDLTFTLFRQAIRDLIVDEHNNYYDAYNMINQMCIDSKIPRINKRYLFENCLLRLLQYMRIVFDET